VRRIKIYDLSLTVSNNLPTYPGDPKVVLKQKIEFSKSGYNVKSIQVGTHSGTHIDAPLHLIDKAANILDVPLDNFIGEATFIEILKEDNEPIKIVDLKKFNIRKDDIVIIRTGWEGKKYCKGYFLDFPYFHLETADYFILKGIKSIGADIPSVDGPNEGGAFHKKILGAGIGVIEALINLEPIVGKRLFFCGVPLKIKDGDGSPIRAVAVDKLDYIIK